MSTDLTTNEFFESLNGFEEIAITRSFGHPVKQLATEDELSFARSLIFVAEKRGGLNDAAAKEAALTLTLGEVLTYFADEDEEPMPEEPVTEAGKGD